MTRTLLSLLVFFASLFGPTLAQAAPGCSDYGRCFELTIQNSLPSIATFAIASGNCYQGGGGVFTMAPGQTVAVGIARVQGHGCDGEQGYFGIVVNGDTTGVQNFQFNNSDGLGFNGVSSKYSSSLSGQQLAPGGWISYTWSAAGTWDNPPICDSSRCFPLYVKNSLTFPISWELIAGNCYQGNQPQPFTVQPGQSYQISLARVQGHGCDGEQGEFSLQPVGSFNNEVQQLNFSNSDEIGLTNATYMYGGQLASLPSVSGAYQWDVNSNAGTSIPVQGCSDQSRCFWLNLANRSSAAASYSIVGGACYQGTIANYTIPAGQQQKIGIARVQGHGCDGRQGNFTASINSDGSTALNFSNEAQLAFTNRNPTYDVTLSSRSVTDDGWFFYEMVLNGPWQNPPICDTSRCFQLYLENALPAPITWQLTAGNCYQGNLPGTFTVQPNSSYQIALARVQGHGCDGKQGEFSLQPVGSLSGEAQNFNFSNDGVLGLTNTPTGYLTALNAKRSDNSYSYTVGENVTHTPTPVAKSAGDWSNPTIKLFNFTTAGFQPNFYQSCFGKEVYHNQHVLRLPNDAHGNAYFMVAQSREHNGYITLLKVNASSVDPTTDVVMGADGATAGTAIWQQVFTGVKNGNIDPVGNWNHPGKMSYMDGILAVSAQNWDMAPWKKFVCMNWYSSVGTSEDKVLFYDMRNVAAPTYLGAMSASELGVPNHELATVGLTFDQLANKYLLVAGGANAYPVLSASAFNPSIANWAVVPGAPSFSGQHGMEFDQQVGGGRQLEYFDASKSDGGFKFTPFTYGATSPYLTGGAEHLVPVALRGAERDWDASSVYISPLTQKPIVYTVKSLDGTSNYQLYQVVPQ